MENGTDAQRFMDDIVSPDILLIKKIHVILDNYCIHKKTDEITRTGFKVGTAAVFLI